MGWLSKRPFRVAGRYAVRPLVQAVIRLRLRRRMRPLAEEELRQPAVVVAPHPDDETLGCGGTVVIKKRHGATVRVLMMTDGAASHPGLIAPEELVAIRADETRDAVGVLGLRPEDVTFLNFSDGNLSKHHAAAVARVAEELRQSRPQQVFLPYFRDGSPDHLATTLIVREAARSACPEALLYEYPVWFWCFWPWLAMGDQVREMREDVRKGREATRHLLDDFSCYVPVADVLDRKEEALAQHRSQLTRFRPVEGWHTLDDVGNGDFVACFRQRWEIFFRYQPTDPLPPTDGIVV
jgi:LmbE family N-acetylglucosaminyl deacetylase